MGHRGALKLERAGEQLADPGRHRQSSNPAALGYPFGRRPTADGIHYGRWSSTCGFVSISTGIVPPASRAKFRDLIANAKGRDSMEEAVLVEARLRSLRSPLVAVRGMSLYGSKPNANHATGPRVRRRGGTEGTRRRWNQIGNNS